MQATPLSLETLPLAHDFISEAWSETGARSEMHVGDLYWGLFNNHRRRLSDVGQLWRNNGQMVALTFSSTGRWYDVVTSATLDPSDCDTLIGHLVVDSAHRQANEKPPFCVRMTRRCADPHFVEALQRCGFQRMDYGYPALINNIADLPTTRLPPGYVTRTHAHLAADNLAAAYSSAFPEEACVTEDCSHVARCAGYEPDLDVAIWSGATVAAFCTAWHDSRNRCGLLEPVGCHADHRRRGLAGHAIMTALVKLRDCGATHAVVRVDSRNSPARTLYESCGFKIAAESFGFELNMDCCKVTP
jgi:GNAT superfamily N-acetyltransferase